MNKMGLYLTTEKYRNILNNIGKSPKPLLISEIRRILEESGMSKSSSPYVYDMIRELAPTETSPLLLFRWDSLPTSYSNNKLGRLLQSLNATFRLDWTIKEDTEYNPNYSNFFKKTGNRTLVIRPFLDLNKRYLTFEISRDQKGTLSIMQHDEKIKDYNIIVRENSGKTYVYLSVVTSVRPKTFLSATPKEDKRTISEIKGRIRNDKQYSQLWGFNLIFLPDFYRELKNIYDFRYRLNIRGLILYILAEVELEKKNKGRRLSQINMVLQNLSKNFVDDFPFLLYYVDFKNEFKGESYYLPRLMIKIATELQYQVYSADIKFLMYWVMKRFSEEIIRHFITPIVWGLWNSENISPKILTDDKLKKYELSTISLLADYLHKEYQLAESDRMELIENRLVGRY
jgi:hypothetical protein